MAEPRRCGSLRDLFSHRARLAARRALSASCAPPSGGSAVLICSKQISQPASLCKTAILAFGILRRPISCVLAVVPFFYGGPEYHQWSSEAGSGLKWPSKLVVQPRAFCHTDKNRVLPDGLCPAGFFKKVDAVFDYE